MTETKKRGHLIIWGAFSACLEKDASGVFSVPVRCFWSLGSVFGAACSSFQVALAAAPRALCRERGICAFCAGSEDASRRTAGAVEVAGAMGCSGARRAAWPGQSRASAGEPGNSAAGRSKPRKMRKWRTERNQWRGGVPLKRVFGGFCPAAGFSPSAALGRLSGCRSSPWRPGAGRGRP